MCYDDEPDYSPDEGIDDGPPSGWDEPSHSTPHTKFKINYRALLSIGELRPEERWRILEDGFAILVKTVETLRADADRVQENSFAAKLISVWLNEEAAKTLVLFDYVRTPDSMPKEQQRQLKYFFSHLAKQIYAEHFTNTGMGFRSFERRIKSAAAEFEHDGSDYESWSFPNQTEALRNELYVGLWETKDSRTGEGPLKDRLSWHNPIENVGSYYFMYRRPNRQLLDVIRVLNKHGLLRADSLAKVREFWGNLEFDRQASDDRELLEKNMDMIRQCGVGEPDWRECYYIGYPFCWLSDIQRTQPERNELESGPDS